MKVKHLLRTTLIAATMLLWSGVGWGQEPIYTVGFESAEEFTASTAYNNTAEKEDGPEGEKWYTYYGTPSTTGPISGSQSMQMRFYTANPDRLGYTYNDFDWPFVTKVTFKALGTNGNNVTVFYSTDGGLSYVGGQLFTLSTSASDFTFNISSTAEYENVRIKFQLTPPASPSNGSRVTIDDVKVYGPDTEAPVPTFSPENSATGVAVDVNPTITFDEAIYTSPASVLVDNDNVESLITFTDGVDPVTFSATITGNVITVVPDAELLNSQSYTLTVAAVEDEVGNAMDAPASATFTTIAAALEVTYSVVGDNGTLAATVDATPITSGDLVDVGSEVIFTATPADGYRVKEWTLNSDVVADNTTNTFTIDDLQEVSAVTVEFEVIPPFYEVTFSVVGDNGTLAATANGDAITSGDEVEEGFEVVFTATPAEDFRVKEWTLNTVVVPDNSTNTFTITGIDAISAVTVEFEAIPEYLVTFTVTDGTDPVEGAIVTVDGTELIATNISGATTVELVDGVYPYTIYAAGLFEKTGEITVSGSVLDVPVELVSLIKEEFDYPVGTLLTDVGYTAHSGGETNSIAVTEASISYSEYASSGIGNEISLLATGQDVNKLFDPQTKDVLYFGLLVNVSSTSTSGDYFFHLSSNPGGAFKGRLWVKEDGDGKIGFGISHGSNTPEYTDFIYDKNSTYLVALKYEFIEGADNDKVAIYINPTVGEVEPSTGWLYSTDSPTDLENIGYYAFRQGSSGNNVNVKVDGVRFSKVFEKVFAVYQSSDATLQTFTLGGLNVLPRTGLKVNDPDTDEGATLFVDDFTGFEGISIAATDDAATVEVYLNEVLVEEANYSAQVLADGDVVVAEVTAEDGTIAYYKVTITGENRELEITGPALPATYNTANDIEFTWTATNIAHVNIYVVETEVGGEAILLNEEGPVDATLGTYTYTVANGDFGTFTVRIEDATDAAFSRETTEVLTVVDNIHPEGVEFYPEMGDVDVPVSFTLSIKFDEDIEAGTGNITINKVSDDTEVLSFTETDFTINNDMLTIDVSGLAFETEYYILADAGVIKDLSGNETPALDDKTVWTFTTMEEPAGDLFISEYIEGSSNNKALELYNPTSSTIDLTQYVIKQANNGNGWGNTSSGPDTRYVLPLTGTLESGKVLVLANASANPAITAVADYTFAYDNTANGSDGSNVLAFNGDDAIGLFKNDVLIDVIGDPDNDPGTNWVVAGTGATSEYTLVRKPGITMGNTNWAASAGTNADDSEWIVHPQDEFSFIGWHGNEPTLSISSPADGSTIYDDKVTVSFAVYNFQVGDNSGGDDDGYVVYKLNAGDEVELKTTDDFELTGLALGEYTLTMWLVDNNGDVLNPEVSRSVTFTIEEISVLTIYEVRYTTEDPALSPYQGEVVTTKGIVTGAYFYSGNERGFFIQDGVTAWNGIMVYTNTDAGNPAIGDEVQVTGKVDHFFNLVQITNSPTFEVLSSDNDVPAPKVLTTAEVAANPAGYQWQSMLLRVEDAECTDNAPGNGRFLVNDGSGVLSIDPGLYAFDPATIEVDKKYNITGFGLFAFSEHRLAPRNASDIELVTSAGVVTEENINVYPNPFSQTLWIDNVQNARSVVVVNLIGQQVVNMQLHGDSRVSIPTEKLPSGVYLISVEGQDGERTVRKVIKR